MGTRNVFYGRETPCAARRMRAMPASVAAAWGLSLFRIFALPENLGSSLRRGGIAALLCCLLSAVACGGVAAAPPPVDIPVRAAALERSGLPNLHKVSDVLYRSGQPTEEGMRELRKMGVRTVISLRSSGLRPLIPPHPPVDDAALAGKDAGLRFVHVPMRAWNPRYEDAVRVLRELRPDNAARQPVLIHCYHGADRTGMMIALYRIVFQNWSREAAIEEMRNGGYGHHAIWKGIATFINTVDIDKLRADALR